MTVLTRRVSATMASPSPNPTWDDRTRASHQEHAAIASRVPRKSLQSTIWLNSSALGRVIEKKQAATNLRQEPAWLLVPTVGLDGGLVSVRFRGNWRWSSGLLEQDIDGQTVVHRLAGPPRDGCVAVYLDSLLVVGGC